MGFKGKTISNLRALTKKRFNYYKWYYHCGTGDQAMNRLLDLANVPKTEREFNSEYIQGLLRKQLNKEMEEESSDD